MFKFAVSCVLAVTLSVAAPPSRAGWGGGSCFAGPAMMPTASMVMAPLVMAPPPAQYTQQAATPKWEWGNDTNGRQGVCLFQNGIQVGAYNAENLYQPWDATTRTWGPPGVLERGADGKPLVNYGINVAETAKDVAAMKAERLQFGEASTIPDDKTKPRVVIKGDDPAVRHAVDAALKDTGLTDKFVVNQYPADHWALGVGYDRLGVVSVVGPPREDGTGVAVHTQQQADEATVATALRKASEKFDATAVPDLSHPDLFASVKAFLTSKSPVGDYTWGTVLGAAGVAWFLLNRYKQNKGKA